MIPRALGLLAVLFGVVLAGARAADKPAAPPDKKSPRKAVNVLLLSDTNNREFQFTRLLLRREVPRWGGELFFHLQRPPRRGIVADTEPPDQLERFPSTLKGIDRTKRTRDRVSNLAWFDVVLAFDVNWKQLDPRAVTLLRRWVNDGGALVFVAGPVNAPALTEAGAGRVWLRGILDLLPVVPDAGRDGLLRPAPAPRRLHFSGPARDLAFLRLDPARAGEPLSGWETFFRGVAPAQPQEMPSPEGFYSLCPVRRVKDGATVLATFADPRARTADGTEQPCLVSRPCGKGRVVYLGCGEFWRLRKSSEDYHRRFWGGLVQYAAGSPPPAEKRTSEILIGSRFTTGEPVELAVRLVGPGGRPLPAASKVRATLLAPLDVKPATRQVDLRPLQAERNWTGWFGARLPAAEVGVYRVEVRVPGRKEPLSARFRVVVPPEKSGQGRQQLEQEQERIASAYSAWRRALVHSMMILSVSPLPAHYQAADRIRRIVEWEERNKVERVIHGSLARHPREQALVDRAAVASRLLGQLRELLKETLFRVNRVPGDREHDWVVNNAWQLLVALEDLEERQRTLPTRLREDEERGVERLRQLHKELTERLFEGLDAENVNNGANKR